jgi:O-antigen ligase
MSALAMPLQSRVIGSLVGAPRRRRTAAQAAVVLAISVLPLLKPAGPGNSGLADVGLLVVMAVAALWLSGGGHVVRLPYAVPVAISVVGGALAGLAAGGGVLALVQDLFLLGWAVAIANLGRSTDLVRTLVRTWALSVTVWAALMDIGVLAHIPLLSGQTALDGSRASLTFGDPNLAANYFLCGLLVLRASRVPRNSGTRFVCCLVIITAIVFTGSNGGMIALLVASCAGGLLRLARRGRPALALALACVLVAIGGVAVAKVDLRSVAAAARQSAPLLRDSIGREAESGGSRSTLVREGLNVWIHQGSPLGLGPGGTKAALLAEQSSYVKEAHDDYLAAVVERGALGGVALVILIVLVAARARRIAKPGALGPDFVEIVPRPELLGVAVGAMLLSGLFYEVLHFRHVWALFGLIAALEIWRSRGDQR